MFYIMKKYKKDNGENLPQIVDAVRDETDATVIVDSMIRQNGSIYTYWAVSMDTVYYPSQF